MPSLNSTVIAGHRFQNVFECARAAPRRCIKQLEYPLRYEAGLQACTILRWGSSGQQNCQEAGLSFSPSPGSREGQVRYLWMPAKSQRLAAHVALYST